MTQHNHFINGKWQQGSGEVLTSINPANDEQIWQGHSATSEEVIAAVSAARYAFYDWSQLTVNERLAYLEVFIQQLEKNQQKLSKIISDETGKPQWEAFNEVSTMIKKLAVSIVSHEERTGTRHGTVSDMASITQHKPHGVVVVLGPFNFPGHLPNGHIIPALLAGNTVVFKPSELTPLAGQSIIELWEKTKIPAGVINCVQGGAEVGMQLTNADIDALFFTGSYAVGRQLHQHFAGRPEILLALEMGGNNPLIVDQVSDLEAAAYLTIQSAFITSGQRCNCARRLIVPHGKAGDDFMDVLINMSAKLIVASPLCQPEPFMGSVISSKQAGKLLATQQSIIDSGGHSLLPMQLLAENTGILTPGIIDVSDIERGDNEIFGPLLQVVRCRDFPAAITEANNTQYGLSAGVLTKNKANFDLFFRHARAGVVNWNQQLTGALSSAPFGGVGHSGNHRPSAFYAADYCAYPVASLQNETTKLPETLTPGIILNNE